MLQLPLWAPGKVPYAGKQWRCELSSHRVIGLAKRVTANSFIFKYWFNFVSCSGQIPTSHSVKYSMTQPDLGNESAPIQISSSIIFRGLLLVSFYFSPFGPHMNLILIIAGGWCLVGAEKSNWPLRKWDLTDYQSEWPFETNHSGGWCREKANESGPSLIRKYDHCTSFLDSKCGVTTYGAY